MGRADSEKKGIEKPSFSGTPTVQKTSIVKKIAKSFISDDVDNLGEVLINEIFVQYAKKALSEAISTGVDMVLYGKSGNPNKTKNGPYISYEKCYENASNVISTIRSGNSVYDIAGNIRFTNRSDATKALDSMQNILDQYPSVSVADLYDICNIPISNAAAGNYGWKNLSEASVKYSGNGYFLDLPKPIPLS